MSDLSRSTVATMFGVAALGGAVAGTASLFVGPAPRGSVAQTGRSLAVESGLVRARDPQTGDSWRGCNEARGAGTAPIYRGEPGYAAEMDGDGDGIACEPRRDYAADF